MFNPKKTNQLLGNPGMLGVILAALIALSLLSRIFSSGAAPKIFLGGALLFGLWWLYTKFIRPDPNQEEMSKYQRAVREQHKKKGRAQGAQGQEKGKVIYLDNVKRNNK